MEAYNEARRVRSGRIILMRSRIGNYIEVKAGSESGGSTTPNKHKVPYLPYNIVSVPPFSRIFLRVTEKLEKRNFIGEINIVYFDFPHEVIVVNENDNFHILLKSIFSALKLFSMILKILIILLFLHSSFT